MEPKFGASFSIKYAYEMNVDPKKCLKAGLYELGIKRLRLMSYWDVHEPVQGNYNFKDLDWQFDLASKYGTRVSLAIGLRQPRWPENHWPKWAKELTDAESQEALLKYIETVLNRYKDHPCMKSWQLENEALLRTFGIRGNFDRKRLKTEFNLVKKLDPLHPVIMSVSDSWGIPIFSPKPDMYGFSLYRYFYDRGQYRHSRRPAIFYRLRAFIIRVLKQRQVFIHELQAEPWAPKSTIEMPLSEQFRSMDLMKAKEAVAYARKTNLLPVDLWGLEWWYWLKTTKDKTEIWDMMKKIFNT